MLQKIIANHFVKLLILSYVKNSYNAYVGYCSFFIQRQGQISLFVYYLTPLPHQTNRRAIKPSKTRIWAK
jgi:hypothetical protein